MLPNIIILSVILLSVTVLLFFRNRLEQIAFRFLLFYLAINFTFEVIAFILTEKSISNIPVYNLQMIFEVTFFLFLYKTTASITIYKKIIATAIASFVAFALVNIIFFQSIGKFNTNTYTLGSFLLIFACGNYLYYSILKDQLKNPLLSLMFWVSLGVLFCYLGNLPFLSNVNELFVFDEGMALRLRLISICVNVLLYLLISIGILCNRKT
jgi:hypothetical protein